MVRAAHPAQSPLVYVRGNQGKYRHHDITGPLPTHRRALSRWRPSGGENRSASYPSLPPSSVFFPIKETSRNVGPEHAIDSKRTFQVDTRNEPCNVSCNGHAASTFRDPLNNHAGRTANDRSVASNRSKHRGRWPRALLYPGMPCGNQASHASSPKAASVKVGQLRATAAAGAMAAGASASGGECGKAKVASNPFSSTLCQLRSVLEMSLERAATRTIDPEPLPPPVSPGRKASLAAPLQTYPSVPYGATPGNLVDGNDSGISPSGFGHQGPRRTPHRC